MPIDPNLAYVLLVIGLWVGATSAYIPGTGIIEGAAILIVFTGVLFMATLPTNMAGLLLLSVGVVGFAIIPFIRKRSLWLIAVGVVLQVVGSVFLYNGLSVSPVLIAVALGIPLAYHTFILTPIMERQFSRPAGALERDANIVGMKGRVVEILNPIGTVYVNGEAWTAEGRRKLKAGMPIVVVAREGLRLMVELDREKYAQMKAMGEAVDLDEEPETPALDQRGT